MGQHCLFASAPSVHPHKLPGRLAREQARTNRSRLNYSKPSGVPLPAAYSSVGLGREAAALGDQRLKFGIGLGSVGLERRIACFLIRLLARPDRIGLCPSAPLGDVDTVDASAVETENLLLERRRKLRIAVLLDQRRRDLKASEGLDLVLRRAVPECSVPQSTLSSPICLKSLPRRCAAVVGSRMT